MEKIIKKAGIVGKGSLAITIPKKWAERLGIKPGSSVSLLFDGSKVLLTPAKDVEDFEEIRGINVLIEVEDMELSLRKLIAAYLEGVTKVKVKANYDVVMSLSNTLRENISMFMLVGEPESKLHEIIFNDVKVDRESLNRTYVSMVSKVLESLLENNMVGFELAYKEYLSKHYYYLRVLKAMVTEGNMDPYEAIDTALLLEYVKEVIEIVREHWRELIDNESSIQKLIEITSTLIRFSLIGDLEYSVNIASRSLQLIRDLKCSSPICLRIIHIISRISEVVLGKCIRNKACRCRHFYPKV